VPKNKERERAVLANALIAASIIAKDPSVGMTNITAWHDNITSQQSPQEAPDAWERPSTPRRNIPEPAPSSSSGPPFPLPQSVLEKSNAWQ
jgi:hypothetical protein